VTARRPEDCEGEHAWRKFAGPGKQLVWRCVVCLTPGGFATMREARAMAETIAREAEQ
jgi:hypothetical protein